MNQPISSFVSRQAASCGCNNDNTTRCIGTCPRFGIPSLRCCQRGGCPRYTADESCVARDCHGWRIQRSAFGNLCRGTNSCRSTCTAACDTSAVTRESVCNTCNTRTACENCNTSDTFNTCHDNRCTSEQDSYSLGMVYAPRQEFSSLYEPREGLCNGTVFQELDLPFLSYRGAK